MNDNQQTISTEGIEESADIPNGVADFSMNEELVKSIQEGNRENIEKLWNMNQGIVRWCLKKYFGFASNQDMEDMSQQAYIGFLEAVRYYDPERGMKFSNYLINRIRKNIYRYFDNCYSIRIPEYMRNRISVYSRAVKELETAGVAVTDEAVMNKTGMSKEAFNGLQKAIQKMRVNSADMEMNEDGNKAIALLDMLEAPERTEDDAIEGVYIQELHRVLNAALAEIPKKQRRLIIEKYYQGFKTQKIAEINACTRQYIYQQIQEAFYAIRHGRYRDELLEFLPEYVERKVIEKEQIAEQLNMTDKEKAFLV